MNAHARLRGVLMSLELYPGFTETISFVGDSRARLFDGMLFHDPNRPNVTITTKARWRPFFRSSAFFDGERFDEFMTSVWFGLRCVGHARERTSASERFTPISYRLSDGTYDQVHVAPRAPGKHRIVVSSGTDVWDIESELFPHTRVRFERSIAAHERLPEYAATGWIAERELYEIIRARSAPLFEGLRVMRDLGFSQLWLLGMMPSYLDHPPGTAPARLRYDVRWVHDRVCEDFCAESGIGFVRIWEALAVNGLRDPRYFADLEHVNEQGALAIMRQLMTQCAMQ